MTDKTAILNQLKELCIAEPTLKVRTPYDIVPDLTARIGDADQEIFCVVTLSGDHSVINIHEITRGLVNRTLIHPREVFSPAIVDKSAAIIVAHNHPSGSTIPSTEDDHATERLKDAAELLGIPILDHLIISTSGYYSYAEGGKI